MNLSGVGSRAALFWLERALLAVGACFAIWCAITVARAAYYRAMPIPAPSHGVAILPGEDPRARHSPAAGDWIGRLDAPSVQLAATVLEGDDDDTLNRAAGHIEGTAMPGDAGNVGVAGHRDTVFRPVRNLQAGAALSLTTRDRVLHYRVSRTAIVDPGAVSVLDATDHPTLTLVTCYPFDFIGRAPRRFVVFADLTGEERR